MSALTPPGSLSVVNSLRAIRDRGFYLKERARHGPIFKTLQFQTKVICIVDLAMAQRLFRDHAECIGPCPQTYSKDVTSGFLRYMKRADYKVYGPMFRRSLARKVFSDATALMRVTARQALQRISGDAEAQGHLLDYTHAVLLRVLFGVERDSPHYKYFEQLLEATGRQSPSGRLKPAAKACVETLRERLSTGPYLQSALADLAEQQGGKPDHTVIDNLLFMLMATSHDSAGLLIWILEFLGRHPEWLDRVAAGTDPALPARIIKETLRLSRSEFLYRQIHQEFEFENWRFPKGWLIRVCVAECHIDPDIYPEPTTYNPDRFLAMQTTDQQYSPFGIRDHACNGVELTYSLATVFIEELASYRLELKGSGRIARGIRHWNHWAPTSRFTLQPRT